MDAIEKFLLQPGLDSIEWAAFITCVLICAVCVAVITIGILINKYSNGSDEVLPPPDRAADRTYGQKYFNRAIGRKEK